MYELEFLPVAKNDMLEIVKYISDNLDNPQAASRLAEEFVEAAENVCRFPYANKVYIPHKPLEAEYRRIIVKNYLMFYTVDESAKTVTIMRVIYGKHDISKRLE